MEAKVKVGSRVKYNGNSGLLRVILDEEDQDGHLVGLELDKPTLTGTNGIFNGKSAIFSFCS